MSDNIMRTIITSQITDRIKQNKVAAFFAKLYAKISFQVEGASVEDKIQSLTTVFNLSSKQTEALKSYYLSNTNASLPPLASRQAYFNEKIEDLNRESRHVTNFIMASAAQFLFINPYTEITGFVGAPGGIPFLRTGIASANLGVAGIAFWHRHRAKTEILKGLTLLPKAPTPPGKPSDWTSVVFRNIPILSFFVDWKYSRQLRQYKKDRTSYLEQAQKTFDIETDGHKKVTRREKYLYAPAYLVNATSSFGSSEFVVQTKDYVPGLGHAVDIIPGIAAYFVALANTGWNGYQTHKSFNANQRSSQERVIASQAQQIEFLRQELSLK